MKSIYISVFFIILISFTSCKKFVEVDSPPTKIDGAVVFESDAAAISVMTGIYARAANPLMGNFSTLSLITGLSADELKAWGVGQPAVLQAYSNELNSSTFTYFWKEWYNYIYATNEVIEGITAPNSLTDGVKARLMGEAKFTRAFFYFYLLNLYGDVPLVTTTDYKANMLMSRTPASSVYTQIIKDLKDAENLMGADYTNADLKTASTTDRVRPNKWTAAALLARVYLFTGDYANAIIESTKVIDQSTVYSLSALDNTFLIGSKETIWALQSTQTNVNTYQGNSFILVTAPSYAYPVSLSDYIYNAFEPGDNRKTSWVGTLTTTGTGAATYHFPYKYKAKANGTAAIPLTENAVIFRLAEQYLIRSEAYIRSNKVPEGVADLNSLRDRARAAATLEVPDPLPKLSLNLSPEAALMAVEHERKVELFTENGDRWFTLKRTKGFTNTAISRADEIMPAITTAKGGTWSTNWQLYPIPRTEILDDVNLVQNPGYN